MSSRFKPMEFSMPSPREQDATQEEESKSTGTTDTKKVPPPTEQRITDIEAIFSEYQKGNLDIGSFTVQVLHSFAKFRDQEGDTGKKNQEIVGSYVSESGKNHIDFDQLANAAQIEKTIPLSTDEARISNWIKDVSHEKFSERSFIKLLCSYLGPAEQGGSFTGAEYGFSNSQVAHWASLTREVVSEKKLVSTANVRKVNKIRGFLIQSILIEMFSKRLEHRLFYLAEHVSEHIPGKAEDFWQSIFMGAGGEQGMLYDIEYVKKSREALSQIRSVLFGERADRDAALWNTFIAHPVHGGEQGENEANVRRDIIAALLQGKSNQAYLRLQNAVSSSDYFRAVSQAMHAREFWKIAEGEGEKSIFHHVVHRRIPQKAEQEGTEEESLESYHTHLFLNLSSVEHPDSLVIHYLTVSGGQAHIKTYEFSDYYYSFRHALDTVKSPVRLLQQIRHGKNLETAMGESGTAQSISIRKGLQLSAITPSAEIPLRSTLIDLGALDTFSFDRAHELVSRFMRQGMAHELFFEHYETALASLSKWRQEKQSLTLINKDLQIRRKTMERLVSEHRNHILIIPTPDNKDAVIYYVHGVVSMKNPDEKPSAKSVFGTFEGVEEPALKYSRYRLNEAIYTDYSQRGGYFVLYAKQNMLVDLGECVFRRKEINARVLKYLRTKRMQQ